jgi:hypothetical protein
MATLTPQTVVLAGLAASFASCAAGGDEFVCPADGLTFVEVVNGDSGSHNITVKAQRAFTRQDGVGQAAVADMVIALAASARKVIGPFPAAYIRGDGKVRLEYSAVTSQTIAVLRLERP